MKGNATFPAFSAMPAQCRCRRLQDFVLSHLWFLWLFPRTEGHVVLGKVCLQTVPVFVQRQPAKPRAERQGEVMFPVCLSDSLAGEHGGDSRLSPGPATGDVDTSARQGDAFLSSLDTPSCVSIRETPTSCTSCSSSSGHFQYE